MARAGAGLLGVGLPGAARAGAERGVARRWPGRSLVHRVVWVCLLLALAGAARADLSGAQLRDLQRLKTEAAAAYRAGRLEAAIQSWQAAYAIAPDPVLLASIGVAHLGLSQAAQALDALGLALAQPSALPPGERATVEGHLASAVTAAEAQAERLPPTIFLLLGDARLLLRQPERAADSYEEYLRRVPEPPLLLRQQVERGLAAFCAAVAPLPPSPGRLLRLARAYQHLGQTPLSLRLLLDAAQAAAGGRAGSFYPVPEAGLGPEERQHLERYLDEVCLRLGGACGADFSGPVDPRLLWFQGDRLLRGGRPRAALPFYARYLREVAESKGGGRAAVLGRQQEACQALMVVGTDDLPAVCLGSGRSPEPAPGPLIVQRRSVARSPWLWAGLGVLVAGGVATALGVTLGRVEAPPGDLVVVH